MGLRAATLTVLAAACATSLTAITPAVADTVRLPASIDLPCAGGELHQEAGWYLPTGRPLGLVWLQHGFARASGNVAALARSLSDAGYLVFTPSLPFLDIHGCTLQNLGDNTAFLDHVAHLFATANDPTGALATSLATAAARAGRIAPAIPDRFVFIGHSAGAEATEYVAHRLHTDSPAAWTGLRGLVLLDPVQSFLGDNTATALTDLDPTGLPILSISGPPSACNALASGTTAVRTLLHRTFIGVLLPTGEHTDAESESSDLAGELACGVPQPVNATTMARLTTDWTRSYFDGVSLDELAQDPATAGTVPLAPA